MRQDAESLTAASTFARAVLNVFHRRHPWAARMHTCVRTDGSQHIVSRGTTGARCGLAIDAP
jgi:hypothetical protein